GVATELSRGTRRVASGDADWPHTGLQRGVIVGVWPASCALSVLSRGGERLVVDPRLVRQGERVTCFEQRLQARQDRGPAVAHALEHLAVGHEVVVDDREL